MSQDEALRTAISVLKVPSRVRLQKSAPLPNGMLLLLNVAAREPDAERQAVQLTGRSIEGLREAATFFIEQILLYPEADSYRALGCESSASASELRTHMAALMRWLHPDYDETGARTALATRVLSAWEQVKSTDRRVAYEASLDIQSRALRARRGRRPRRWPQHEGTARRLVRSVVALFSLR